MAGELIYVVHKLGEGTSLQLCICLDKRTTTLRKVLFPYFLGLSISLERSLSLSLP